MGGGPWVVQLALVVCAEMVEASVSQDYLLLCASDPLDEASPAEQSGPDPAGKSACEWSPDAGPA